MATTVIKATPNGSKLLSSGNIVTAEGRFSFLSLFKKTKSPKFPESKEKYSATLLFKKDEDLSILQGAYIDVMTKQFGAQDQWPKKELAKPFRKQGEWYKSDGKTLYEGCEAGAYYIVCRSDQKPGVVDARANYIEDESQIFSGCYGRLTIRAFWPKSNNGVIFGLQNVQMTRTGDPFGSARVAAEDEFDKVEGDPMSAPAAGADTLASMMD